jgi:hypothetical protein
MKRMAMALWIVMLCGCTHHQLKFNTSQQARTVADVHTQQVLDNLAKFVANPGALPHFSWPNAGASGVTDLASGSGSLAFSPHRLTGWGLGMSGSRQSLESYTMTPINDPRKLELMRCAYQRAAAAHTGRGEACHCPDCSRRLNNFYLGKAVPGDIGKTTHDGLPIYRFETPNGGFIEVYETKNEVNDVEFKGVQTGEAVLGLLTVEEIEAAKSEKKLRRLYVQDSVEAMTQRTGTVTSACIHSGCWFRAGGRWDVPRRGCCQFVGRYCDTYVWVPNECVDQLTMLTLTILDIATNNPPTERTKDVVVYLDAYGNLSTEDKSSYAVTASIPVSASVDAVQARNTKSETQATAEVRAAALRLLVPLSNEAKSDLKLSNLDGSGTLNAFMSQENLAGELPVDEESAESLRRMATVLSTKAVKGTDNTTVQRAEVLLDALEQLKKVQQHKALESRTEMKQYEIEMQPPTRTFEPSSGILQFRQNLDTLTP